MQSAQRTGCPSAAHSSCAPPPGVGFEAAPELLKAAVWPSPPSGLKLSSGSAQTPAAGTYRSRHNDRPARLGAGSLCVMEEMEIFQSGKITNQPLQSWKKERTSCFNFSV